MILFVSGQPSIAGHTSLLTHGGILTKERDFEARSGPAPCRSITRQFCQL
jgi:hypothetical protein